MFGDEDVVLHPDELQDRYKEVLGETSEWRVFRSRLPGHSGYIFLWNHQLGYGVQFSDEGDSFLSLSQAMVKAYEAKM